MAEDLRAVIAERIHSGLRRKAVKKPSKWAELYRELPNGRWSFKRHPWLLEMHDSEKQKNVGQKAAQMGFTETLLNLSFYGIDIRGFSVLYVLPNKNPDASDFSATRFAPALSLSPHLQNLFTDSDNIGLKRAGAASLYVRGSQSRSALKSIPVNYVFLDELAEFNQDNVPLAFARTDGQAEWLHWLISTPTIGGHGINKYWNLSDQRYFFFECPSCKRMVDLKFPESLIITADDSNDLEKLKQSHLICHQCKAKLPHETKCDWLSKNQWVKSVVDKDAEYAGFTISQLYSPVIPPWQLAQFYLHSLTNVADEVEFYNSKLGIPYIVKGHRVTDDDIEYAMYHGAKYRGSDFSAFNGCMMTMGVDVGPRKIHYEIAKWTFDKSKFYGDVHSCSKPQVICHGIVPEFTDLDKLMAKYRILSCVIDGNPERRMAADFAKRHYGRVKLCFFGQNIQGKTYVDSKVKYDGDPVILVDRTTWLDQALGRFINRTISLPIDVDIEYKDQVKEPAKTYKKDSDGNPVATYLTADGRDDHYAFARCYNEIAYLFVANIGQSQDI